METEVLIKSLLLILSSFVNVEYCPLLVVSSVVAPYSNCLTFFVSTALDIKDLAVLPVDELLVLILEDLPPSRVGAPDLHVVGSTRASDVP